jgi:hypothetical protein
MIPPLPPYPQLGFQKVYVRSSQRLPHWRAFQRALLFRFPRDDGVDGDVGNHPICPTPIRLFGFLLQTNPLAESKLV